MARLQLSGHTGHLALFNLAVGSRLRSCDLVCLRVRDLNGTCNAVAFTAP